MTHLIIHNNPTYYIDDAMHYCITNMPRIMDKPSTFILTDATFPYFVGIRGLGYEEALMGAMR